MWQLLLRILLAGLIVVAVTEIARLWPRLAAIILFVPLVPPLVLLSMYMKDGDAAAVSHLSRQSLLLIPLGLMFFVPLALVPALKIPFWLAFAGGIGLMSAAVGSYLYLGR
jgi:hypothetical protein